MLLLLFIAVAIAGEYHSCPKETFWRNGECSYFKGGLNANLRKTANQCCVCPEKLLKDKSGVCFTPSRIAADRRVVVDPKCCDGTFKTWRMVDKTPDPLPAWLAKHFGSAIVDDMDKEAGFAVKDHDKFHCTGLCMGKAKGCLDKCMALGKAVSVSQELFVAEKQPTPYQDAPAEKDTVAELPAEEEENKYVAPRTSTSVKRLVPNRVEYKAKSAAEVAGDAGSFVAKAILRSSKLSYANKKSVARNMANGAAKDAAGIPAPKTLQKEADLAAMAGDVTAHKLVGGTHYKVMGDAAAAAAAHEVLPKVSKDISGEVAGEMMVSSAAAEAVAYDMATQKTSKKAAIKAASHAASEAEEDIKLAYAGHAASSADKEVADKKVEAVPAPIVAGNTAYETARALGVRKTAAKKFADNAAKTAVKAKIPTIKTVGESAELNAAAAASTAADVSELEGKSKGQAVSSSEDAAAYAAATSVEAVQDASEQAKGEVAGEAAGSAVKVVAKRMSLGDKAERKQMYKEAAATADEEVATGKGSYKESAFEVELKDELKPKKKEEEPKKKKKFSLKKLLSAPWRALKKHGKKLFKRRPKKTVKRESMLGKNVPLSDGFHSVTMESLKEDKKVANAPSSGETASSIAAKASADAAYKTGAEEETAKALAKEAAADAKEKKAPETVIEEAKMASEYAAKSAVITAKKEGASAHKAAYAAEVAAGKASAKVVKKAEGSVDGKKDVAGVAAGYAVDSVAVEGGASPKAAKKAGYKAAQIARKELTKYE